MGCAVIITMTAYWRVSDTLIVDCVVDLALAL